mgnify:CR=1 FL=1
MASPSTSNGKRTTRNEETLAGAAAQPRKLTTDQKELLDNRRALKITCPSVNENASVAHLLTHIATVRRLVHTRFSGAVSTETYLEASSAIIEAYLANCSDSLASNEIGYDITVRLLDNHRSGVSSIDSLETAAELLAALISGPSGSTEARRLLDELKQGPTELKAHIHFQGTVTAHPTRDSRERSAGCEAQVHQKPEKHADGRSTDVQISEIRLNTVVSVLQAALSWESRFPPEPCKATPYLRRHI